jgi:hypothetical protein
MKLESLVTVNQLRHGEYVPGSCTHRPSTHGRQGHPKDLYPAPDPSTVDADLPDPGMAAATHVGSVQGRYHGDTADWE